MLLSHTLAEVCLVVDNAAKKKVSRISKPYHYGMVPAPVSAVMDQIGMIVCACAWSRCRCCTT